VPTVCSNISGRVGRNVFNSRDVQADHLVLVIIKDEDDGLFSPYVSGAKRGRSDGLDAYKRITVRNNIFVLL